MSSAVELGVPLMSVVPMEESNQVPDCAFCWEPVSEEEQRFTHLNSVGSRDLHPGYAMHGKCANQWFARNNTCPLCRGVITVDLLPTEALNLGTQLRNKKRDRICMAICCLVFAVPLTYVVAKAYLGQG